MAPLTQRQRFVDALRFRPVDRVPFMEIALWSQTRDRWEREGMPHGVTCGLMQGCSEFGLEGYRTFEVDIGPMPKFEEQFLAEDADTRVFVDSWGRTRRGFRSGAERGELVSMDQFLRYPIEDRVGFEEMRVRFDASSPGRLRGRKPSNVSDLEASDEPMSLMNPIAGTFGFYSMLRNWFGTERLSYLWHDDPGLIDACLDHLCEFALQLFDRALRETKCDFYYVHEDMAGKGGPLIGPGLFRRFLLPHYRRLVGMLRSNGVEVVLVDTDGDFEVLIPPFLEAGVDGFGPIEMAAGMDPVRLRRKFGKSFAMVGGIDKREIAKGRRAIDAQIDGIVRPLIEDGGFIPTIDHSVPPDVSYADFCYYLEQKRKATFG